MPTRLQAVVVDATDPERLAAFWAAALGWTASSRGDGQVAVGVPDAPAWGEGGPLTIVFVSVPEPKTGKNRTHLDLSSSSLADQRATVERLRGLGADPVDIGQEAVPWVVLADPEGNEFCVLDPRESYRDAGPVAAVAVDCADPVELANFWIRAAGWPVIRYSDRFAALRHPRTPTTWLEFLEVPDPKTVKNRLHLDIAPRAGGDLAAEVARLEQAGGRRIDIGHGPVPWVMADPQDNEFCVLPPR